MNKITQMNMMTAPITDTKSLRTVLDAHAEYNLDYIQRLALSAKPDDNYERIKLIGANDLIIRLLSQIK